MAGSATVDPPRNHRLMACERPVHATAALSSELAVRAFDAEIAFNEALSDFQAKNLPKGQLWAEFLQAANRAGFSWSIRYAHPDSLELILAHCGGFQVITHTAPAGLLPALLGLLGVLVSTLPAVDREAACSTTAAPSGMAFPQPAEPEPAAEPAPASPFVATVQAAQAANAHAEAAIAAQSLAAVTDGAVAAPEPSSGPVEAGPLAAAHGDPTTPLTAEQRATALAMVDVMARIELKAFNIAFRNAFNVPRTVTSLKPLITQRQHLELIDRFTTEAAGRVAA